MNKLDITTMFKGMFKSWGQLWDNIVLLQDETIEIPMEDFKKIVLTILKEEVK